jgi:hypothetical protein
VRTVKILAPSESLGAGRIRQSQVAEKRNLNAKGKMQKEAAFCILHSAFRLNLFSSLLSAGRGRFADVRLAHRRLYWRRIDTRLALDITTMRIIGRHDGLFRGLGKFGYWPVRLDGVMNVRC